MAVHLRAASKQPVGSPRGCTSRSAAWCGSGTHAGSPSQSLPAKLPPLLFAYSSRFRRLALMMRNILSDKTRVWWKRQQTESRLRGRCMQRLRCVTIPFRKTLRKIVISSGGGRAPRGGAFSASSRYLECVWLVLHSGNCFAACAATTAFPERSSVTLLPGDRGELC